MARTLDVAPDRIRDIQGTARRQDTPQGKSGRPQWPMTVLRSPKDWTGPKEVDGVRNNPAHRSDRHKHRWHRLAGVHRRCRREQSGHTEDICGRLRWLGVHLDDEADTQQHNVISAESGLEARLSRPMRNPSSDRTRAKLQNRRRERTAQTSCQRRSNCRLNFEPAARL